MVSHNSSEGGFFVYLGPTIRGVIQTSSLFPGTKSQVEESIAHAISRYPRIKNLLVSSTTFAADRIKVKQPGNYLYNEYKRLVAEMKKKEE